MTGACCVNKSGHTPVDAPIRTIFSLPIPRRYFTRAAVSSTSLEMLEYPKPEYELRIRNSQSEQSKGDCSSIFAKAARFVACGPVVSPPIKTRAFLAVEEPLS